MIFQPTVTQPPYYSLLHQFSIPFKGALLFYFSPAMPFTVRHRQAECMCCGLVKNRPLLIFSLSLRLLSVAASLYIRVSFVCTNCALHGASVFSVGNCDAAVTGTIKAKFCADDYFAFATSAISYRIGVTFVIWSSICYKSQQHSQMKSLKATAVLPTSIESMSWTALMALRNESFLCRS